MNALEFLKTIFHDIPDSPLFESKQNDDASITEFSRTSQPISESNLNNARSESQDSSKNMPVSESNLNNVESTPQDSSESNLNNARSRTLYSYIWSRNNENKMKRTNSFLIQDLESLVNVSKRLNEQKLHVSFSMGLLDRHLGTYERAKSTDIVAIPCLWCDIDIADAVHGQNQTLAPDIETARSFLPKELPPSIIVDSGFGIHAYWIFDHLLPTTTDSERSRAKKLLEQLQSVIRHNAGEYFIDPTADLSRMLRLPDTINWKVPNKKDAPICKVIDASETWYDVAFVEKTLANYFEVVSENPREISTSQKDFLQSRGNFTTNDSISQESSDLLFENCSFCRYCHDHIESLSQPDFVNFFPNLLKAKDGREIALELCKRRFGEKFEESKTQMHIESLAQLKPITCERIATLYPQSCNFNSCIVNQLGKKSPSAILLSPKVKNAIIPDTVGEIFDNAPESIRDLRIPNGFSLSKSRIVDERGKSPKTALNTPVVISREVVFADSNKIAFYELTYLKKGHWRTCIVKPATISDSKMLVNTLASEGILVSSKQSGNASDFFNSFIELNESSIPSVQIFNKLGWFGREFILPSMNDGKYLIFDDQANQKIGKRGDRQISIDLLREISQYPFARLIVNANLAAPLLELVECRNFILDLVCKSHQGKTMSLLFANSLWGSQKWMVNFNATVNAAEEFGAARNSLPTNINEWQMTNSRTRDEISNQIVHRFSEGEGRSRLNRDGTAKTTKSWNGIMITTSEEPLTAENAFQGVKTRCLEIQADTVIGTVDDDGKTHLNQDLCKRIYHETKQNYGHLGVEFIERLQEEIANDVDFANLRGESMQYADLVMKSRNARIIASYAEYIAILAMAHRRICKWFLGMREEDAIESTLQFIATFGAMLPTEEEISDIARAKDTIIDWISAYSRHFAPSSEEDLNSENPNNGLPVVKAIVADPCYGFWIKDDLYVNPSELKKALSDRGFSPRKILKEWAMSGDIETDPNDRHLSMMKRNSEGKNQRVIGLTFIHDTDIASWQKQIDETLKPTISPEDPF